MMLSPEHTLAILQLYARYNQSLDAGNVDDYLRCFARDGVLSRNGSPLTGPDQLSRFVAEVAPTGLKHMVSNIVVNGSEDLGPEFAVGYADLLVLQAVGDQLSIMTAGSYGDLLCRTEGEWVFKQRLYVTTPLGTRSAVTS